MIATQVLIVVFRNDSSIPMCYFPSFLINAFHIEESWSIWIDMVVSTQQQDRIFKKDFITLTELILLGLC